MLFRSPLFRSACLLFLAALALLSSSAATAQQPDARLASDYFTVKEVARGVWAFIVKPGGPSIAASNSAAIEMGDYVVVVDSHLSPVAAREAARLVASLTGNKPVRYLVNTHWHPDHVQGNAAYREASRGAIEIIAHMNTRRDIVSIATPFLKEQKVLLPKQLAQAKEQLSIGMAAGRPMSDEQRRRIEAQIKHGQALLGEISNLEIALPTFTLAGSLTLHGGGRELRILHLGKGHTEGDVVVFLPREKILISGDLVTNSIPLMRDAFPLEWGATLAAVEPLDYAQNIPGHGDVQQGKERLQMLRAFLDDLAAAVRQAFSEGKTVEEAKKSVKAGLAPRHERNFSSWNGGAEAAIERAFNQLIKFPR